ncbi:hypothetical protein [Frigidibacter sp. MR17.24]|uniref:hypothetical protein n=1 Tax=Frigidibacter sp. MR17.24 TaxID=3127345 RepID=UPI003012B89E
MTSRYAFHQCLTIRDITRSYAYLCNKRNVTLDNANDASLIREIDGTDIVYDRYAGTIGSIPAGLRGAARIGAALRIVRDFRAAA